MGILGPLLACKTLLPTHQQHRDNILWYVSRARSLCAYPSTFTVPSSSSSSFASISPLPNHANHSAPSHGDVTTTSQHHLVCLHRARFNLTSIQTHFILIYSISPTSSYPNTTNPGIASSPTTSSPLHGIASHSPSSAPASKSPLSFHPPPSHGDGIKRFQLNVNSAIFSCSACAGGRWSGEVP